MKKPIDYAKWACDTMMDRYEAADLPPKGHFHYHQGVFLSGMYQTYLLCGEEQYFNYIKAWVDSCMDSQGNILHYEKWHLDDIQPGILLFPLWERTGEEKYRKAIEGRMEIISEYPKNKAGGFWHMDLFKDQMWLDGLYMVGPICAQYAKVFQKPEYMESAIEQALLMQEKTRDKESGLWYHAWDSLGITEWADPISGCSGEFWGRSIGWVSIAVLDELKQLDKGHEKYQELCDLVSNLLTAVCHYQSEDGRWYQVVNRGNQKENWLENSCSCLFAAAIYRAVDMGILGRKYLQAAQRGYQAVIRSLQEEEGDLLIGNVCIGTGVGDYKHYCERPVSVNDLHGVGAFLLMCAEAEQANRKEGIPDENIYSGKK